MAAKKTTKRQQPSKPGVLKSENPRTRSSEAPSAGHLDHENESETDRVATGGPAHTDGRQEGRVTNSDGTGRVRTKDEIEAGKKKGQYEILMDGAHIDGKPRKMGDTVTMTRDDADNHRSRGVALAGPKE